jgi:hypothetical protein
MFQSAQIGWEYGYNIKSLSSHQGREAVPALPPFLMFLHILFMVITEPPILLSQLASRVDSMSFLAGSHLPPVL